MLKRILLLAIILSATVSSFAQNLRTVKGRVLNQGGRPVPVAVIVPEGTEIKASPNEDGSFEIKVPFSCRFLTVSADAYVSQRIEIDGSFLFVTLKVDVKAVEAAAREAEARAKAEAEAKARAEKERIAAEAAAKKEAEAKAKAEAEAKAKAEEKARLAAEEAERERIAEEEAARKATEAEKKAKIAAAVKAEIQAKDAEYDSRYKNHGISHSLTFSYAYEMASGIIRYRYSGIREYGNLHPMEVDYTLRYKLNRKLSLGIGSGCLFNAKSTVIKGDEFAEFYGPFEEKRLDIPVFASIQYHFGRKGLRPFAGLSGGYYVLSGIQKADAGLGLECRMGRSVSADIQVKMAITPWPEFKDGQIATYTGLLTPGVSVGLNF
ncbi:MAG: hypothetical protein J5632_01150 [Bacteroidales bacterium]|nr:hypothetical protein [Bacteroidales bacterium]